MLHVFNMLNGPIKWFMYSTCYVYISDVTVGFQQMSYVVREEDGFVMVCVLLSGNTQREVLVDLTTLSGSAQGQI